MRWWWGTVSSLDNSLSWISFKMSKILIEIKKELILVLFSEMSLYFLPILIVRLPNQCSAMFSSKFHHRLNFSIKFSIDIWQHVYLIEFSLSFESQCSGNRSMYVLQCIKRINVRDWIEKHLYIEQTSIIIRNCIMLWSSIEQYERRWMLMMTKLLHLIEKISNFDDKKCFL